jgi:vesicular inhibitory amino acid transporter
MQVNIYMGLGLLSMPYAMRLAGWFGLLALMASTAIFCVSAKLLIQAFQTLPAGMLHSYPNLGAPSLSPLPLIEDGGMSN